MNHEQHDGPCPTCGCEPSKKEHKQIFNADFLFILISGVVLNVYALTYTYAIFG